MSKRYFGLREHHAVPDLVDRKAVLEWNVTEFWDYVWNLADPFMAQSNETVDDLSERLTLSIDKLPDLYLWLLQVRSWYAVEADAVAELHGQRSLEARLARDRRDAAEDAAKAFKVRYEGASRRITILLAEREQAEMRSSR